MFRLLQSCFHQTGRLEQQLADIREDNKILQNSLREIKCSLQISMPPQVLLQHPVILHDALGQIAPVHLDFIDSPEAFLAVLEIRFRYRGSRKIRCREFDLRDAARQNQIDLQRPWKRVFMVCRPFDICFLGWDAYKIAARPARRDEHDLYECRWKEIFSLAWM
jgi:hypothetical protein